MNLAAPRPTPVTWRRKDLLGIQELSAEEITLLLDTAREFKLVGARDVKKVPALRGRTLVNFFVEPSTRTRTSFELAAMRLSADVVNVSASTSSLVKGETLKDTALVLQANNVDIIVIRHSSAGAAQFLAERLQSCIINAGDGAHEHPTQALLDLFTIREKCGRIDGLHVAIVGDILFSRVARSNIWGLLKLGAQGDARRPEHAGPARVRADGSGGSCGGSMKCSESVDVINLLRIQHERQRRGVLSRARRICQPVRPDARNGRIALLKPDCLIMHPGPINRGRGDRQRRGRRPAPQRHPRAGDERTRRADGRAVSLRCGPRRRGRKRPSHSFPHS